MIDRDLDEHDTAGDGSEVGPSPSAPSPSSPPSATFPPSSTSPVSEPRERGAPSTQVMVLGWCVWLASSWGLALWFGSMVPAARWLVVLALMGLMLVWPTVRLSAAPSRMTPGAVWGEWLCLILVLQAGVWPLRLLSQWRMDQTLWLAGTLAAWTLLTAAVVAMGVQARSWGPRVTAMVVCMLLVVGEPAAMSLAVALGGMGAWEMQISPLATVWGLMLPALDVSLDPWPTRVSAAAAAAVGAWIVVWVTWTRGKA